MQKTVAKVVLFFQNTLVFLQNLPFSHLIYSYFSVISKIFDFKSPRCVWRTVGERYFQCFFLTNKMNTLFFQILYGLYHGFNAKLTLYSLLEPIRKFSQANTRILKNWLKRFISVGYEDKPSNGFRKVAL